MQITKNNKKAFVFSLDASIALIITILVIILIGYYMGRAGDTSLPSLQMIKTGDDVLRILDEDSILDSLDENLIENNMTTLLPDNYEMKVGVNCTEYENGMDITYKETPAIIPDDRFIGSGTRFFVIPNGADTNYCIGRFWIWLK